MALIAALFAASLVADPARLVLGKDAGAELTVRGPSGASVTLSASVGTVSAPRHDGDLWRARFTPPPLKAPSVALLLAQFEEDGERQLAWLAIPLSGTDTMEIETRPGSNVSAEVAGATVGPVIADRSGTARLPMIVPPGVAHGTLHIVDKLGNSSDKPIDLDPPPFSRVRVAARSSGAGAAVPLELEIFVVKPDGTPDDNARVGITADDGEAEVQKRVGPGIYLARYLSSAGKSGVVHLEAKANGQLAAVDVPVTVRRSVIGQPFWRSAHAARWPWSVAVGILGGGGATGAGAGEGTVLLEAAMRLDILPVEAVLDLGASYFSEVTQYGATPTNDERARAQSRLAQVGLRLGRELASGLDGHATLLFGFQSQVVGRTLPNNVQVAQDDWTRRFALALGVNATAGPGRVLVQLQLDSSADGIAGLAGSLSGIQAMLGYLVTVY